MGKTIRHITEYKNIKSKVVGIRADFDVFLEDGKIIDERKIKAVIPTINYLLKNQCKVVLISHLGAGNGLFNDELSLMPIRFLLGRILVKQIKFANIKQCENSIKFMDFGEVLLLENINFEEFENKGSEEKRKEMVKPLLKLLDLFVIESVDLSSKSSSVSILAEKLPTYYGFNYFSEMEISKKLNEMQASGEKIIFLVGGENVLRKLKVIKSVANKKSIILAAGKLGVYLSFLSKKIKNKIFDEKSKKEIQQILSFLEKRKIEIVIPIDFVVKTNKKPTTISIKELSDINPESILDIGEQTIALFKKALEEEGNIVAHGATGKFEEEGGKNSMETLLNAISFLPKHKDSKILMGESISRAIATLDVREKGLGNITCASIKV